MRRATENAHYQTDTDSSSRLMRSIGLLDNIGRVLFYYYLTMRFNTNNSNNNTILILIVKLTV